MASKKFLQLVPDDSFTVLNLGDMEIWDGADMALLREALLGLDQAGQRLAIGVDMTYVKYIPSGFFGMLFDWFETGVQIRLYTPQPNVRKMLWFHQFFEAVGHESYELAPQPDGRYETGYSANGAAATRGARGETKKAVARAAQ
jgi:hypothetical protein